MSDEPADTVRCPACNGAGETRGIACSRGRAGKGCMPFALKCDTCDGTGKLTPEAAAEWERRFDAGQAIRQKRRAAGRTLLQEAKRLGISGTAQSNRERGMDIWYLDRADDGTWLAKKADGSRKPLGTDKAAAIDDVAALNATL